MKGFYWTSGQRRSLEEELKLAPDGEVLRRVLALLEVDKGRPVEEVARELGVGRSSVYRWIERYASERRIQALERRPGQGRPGKSTAALEEYIRKALSGPPLEWGYPANGWTLPLLQACLSVDCPSRSFPYRPCDGICMTWDMSGSAFAIRWSRILKRRKKTRNPA
jgi:transposase